MTEILWQPSAERIKSSQLTHFIQKVQQKYGIRDTNYSTLHQWSVSNPTEFWEAVWQDCGIIASTPYTSVMGKRLMSGTKWFGGARLNYAENLLRYRELEQEAIIFVDERKRSVYLSFKELAEQVARCAAGLRELGVSVGDRVAAVIPNCPEAVIAALAASSIGAIWSSCSPDFGLRGIYDRLGQISPKVLITANAYYYNGKEFDCLERIKGVLGKIASIQRVAIIQYTETPYTSFHKGQAWEEFMVHKEAELAFEQLPFDHPLSILYSSGTTGCSKINRTWRGRNLNPTCKRTPLSLRFTARRPIILFYYLWLDDVELVDKWISIRSHHRALRRFTRLPRYRSSVGNPRKMENYPLWYKPQIPGYCKKRRLSSKTSVFIRRLKSNLVYRFTLIRRVI